MKKAEEGRQKAEGFVQTGIQTLPEREKPETLFTHALDTLTPFGRGQKAKAFLPPSAFCPLPFLVSVASPRRLTDELP